MQKFARDQMRSFAKGNPLQAEEQALCEELAGLMGKDMEASGANKMEAWDNQWEKVYELCPRDHEAYCRRPHMSVAVCVLMVFRVG